MAFSLPSMMPARDPAGSSTPSPDQAVPPPRPSNAAAKSVDDALASLRQKLDDESSSAELLICSTAEAAQTLTGSDGIAIALRSRGAVICRARSGDLAPDLGTPLNLQSGISGECLRSASILVCNDTLNDSRVDAEVCRNMGIGSLVAVPLRGAVGTAGILEAFSSRTNTFGEEQIDLLRELAKIAESAYQRERRAQDEETLAQLRGARRLPNLFNRKSESTNVVEMSTPSVEEVEAESSDSFSVRRYWVLGMLILAVLAVLGVWLSWREPLPDLAKAEAKSPAPSAVTDANRASENTVLAKPKAAVVRSGGDSRSILKKAADIEPENEEKVAEAAPLTPANDRRAESIQPSPGRPPSSASETEDVPAPQVAINSDGAAPVATLVSDSKALPVMGMAVSQGITHGELIRKVDPAYPVQARAQRIAGSVVLQVVIGLDGAVHNIKTVSGDPLLAASARDAVRQWHYNPVLLNGKPIEAEKQVTVLFKLP